MLFVSQIARQQKLDKLQGMCCIEVLMLRGRFQVCMVPAQEQLARARIQISIQ
jgi:hypothetical protein